MSKLLDRFGNLISDRGLLHPTGLRSPMLPPVWSSFSIPTTAAEYEALGMPAPSNAWDMQSADVPFAPLFGSETLGDELANSDGWTFENSTGLPGGQLCASRDGINTSRSLATSGTTFMDVGTTERVAIGQMWRHTIALPASGSEGLLWQKRSGDGYRAQMTTLGYPQLMGRPATGGDILATVAVEHSLNVWHYGIWIMDRDAGVETGYLHTQLGTASVSLAGKGSFTRAVQWGFGTGAAPGQQVAAFCVWEGADVALLTQGMCQDFLDAAGV